MNNNFLFSNIMDHVKSINKMQININTIQNDLNEYKQKLIMDQKRSDIRREILRELLILDRFIKDFYNNQ